MRKEMQLKLPNNRGSKRNRYVEKDEDRVPVSNKR